MVTKSLVLTLGLAALLANHSFAFNPRILINRRPQCSLPGRLTPMAIPFGTATTVPVSRHHIVPSDLLVACFNRIMERSAVAPSELKIFAIGLSHLVGVGRNIYAGRPWITGRLDSAHRLVNRMRDGEININTNLERNDAVGMAVLQSIFIWMPGNIFIGPSPSLRSDDPSNDLETEAGTIVGEEAFGRLESLYFRMHAYTTHGEVQADDSSIEGIVNLIKELPNYMYLSGARHWSVVEGEEQTLTLNLCGTSEHALVRARQVNERESRREKRARKAIISVIELSSLSDPFCLQTVQVKDNLTLLDEWNLKTLNLDIAQKLFLNVKSCGGFFKKDFSSWKEFYNAKTWYTLTISFLEMYNGFRRAGFFFNDGSFSIGVEGSDSKLGDDNWTTVKGKFNSRYQGAMFFDKNGRPVAIVISSRNYANLGTGWSFIYVNRKWEYENLDDWHERRFSGTESLDPSAPKFVII